MSGKYSYLIEQHGLKILLLSAMLLTGCGGVSFSQPSGSASSVGSTTGNSSSSTAGGSSSSTDTGSSSAQPAPAPTPAPSGPVTPPVVAIEIKWTSIRCVPESNGVPGACVFDFVLQQALTQAYSFNWKTDDSAFGTAAPAGLPPYGENGVDYKSSSGTVTFAAGSTMESISIPDINPGLTAFTVRIIESDCLYGGSAQYANCATDIVAGP